MKPAGRIALAAATATALVSGTAAAFAATHPDTEQVAEVQADPHAHLKAVLTHRLDRLDARAADLRHRLTLADRNLSAAQRALREARAEAARQAAAAATAVAAAPAAPAASPQPQASHATQPPAPEPVVTQPEPHTSSGASGSTGGEDDGAEDDGGNGGSDD